jgi:hypothetical protein
MHWRNHKLYQILFKHLILNHVKIHNQLVLTYGIITINCQSFSQELHQWLIHYAKCYWTFFTVCQTYLIQNISELGSTSVIVQRELEWNFNSAVLILMFFHFYKLLVWFQPTMHKKSDKNYWVFHFLKFMFSPSLHFLINSLIPDTRIVHHSIIQLPILKYQQTPALFCSCPVDHKAIIITI